MREVVLWLKMNGFPSTIYAYRVANLAFPLILGNPWKVHDRVWTASEEGQFFHERARRWMLETRRKSLDTPWPGKPAEECNGEPTTHAVILITMQ